MTFGRKCNLENFVKHASCLPSLSVPRGSFTSKGCASLAGLERGILFRFELNAHPGMFVCANLYSTGVVKVTLAKADLTLVFDQIRDSLSAINAVAEKANPPLSVYDSSISNPLAWSTMKLALIKKQFDLGFRIK